MSKAREEDEIFAIRAVIFIIGACMLVTGVGISFGAGPACITLGVVLLFTIVAK